MRSSVCDYGRVNYRQRVIWRLGHRRVIVVAYVTGGVVGAIASRQERVGLIWNQVVPFTRGEEVLEVH